MGTDGNYRSTSYNSTTVLYRIDLAVAVAVSSLATDLIYPASYEWLSTLVLHMLWAWDYARSQGGRAQGTAAPERRAAETSMLASVEKADSRIPGSPNREQAGASTQSGSKDKIKEDIVLESDVIYAERAEDGCCTKCVRYWSGLIESGATFTVSLRGSAELQA